jgi:hypothetical protein
MLKSSLKDWVTTHETEFKVDKNEYIRTSPGFRIF